MDGRGKDSNYEFHPGPFGQLSRLWNLYTQLTFCYAKPDNVSQDKIVETLHRGLERITSSFPWVAGQVMKEADPEHLRADYYVVRAFESIPRFVVKDLTDVLPSFDRYKELRFPFSLLDENVIAPRKTMSASDESEPKPVFLVQATFIGGGVLLTFVAQHGIMDLVGEGEVIRLLSKACHDIAFTEEELELGTRDRRTVVPLLDERQEQHGIESVEQSESTLR